MSRAVAMTCPNCGANLSAPEDATGAACSYCGQSCVIRGRTRFLQLQRPLPQLPVGARVVVPPVNVSRLAWLGILPILGFLAGMGAVVYAAIASHRAAKHAFSTTSTSDGAADVALPEWSENGPPLLRDINGDGVDDIIGVVRDLHANDQMYLAAYDGTSGQRRWQSPSLGGYTEARSGTTYLAPNLVLRTNNGGVLRAFDVATGAPAWATPLGEKITMVCEGATGTEVDVMTSDAMIRRVTLATGAAAGATPSSRYSDDCGARAPLPSTATVRDLRKETRPWKLYTLDGFKIEGALRRGDVVIVRGAKATGTSVPLIGRIAPDRTSWVWQAQVPAQHPLTARSEAAITAVSDDLAFAVYEASELPAPHLTAFSLANGARQWDVEVPNYSGTGAIAVNQRAVMISNYSPSGVMAFELATGKLLFAFGR